MGTRGFIFLSTLFGARLPMFFPCFPNVSACLFFPFHRHTFTHTTLSHKDRVCVEGKGTGELAWYCELGQEQMVAPLLPFPSLPSSLPLAQFEASISFGFFVSTFLFSSTQTKNKTKKERRNALLQEIHKTKSKRTMRLWICSLMFIRPSLILLHINWCACWYPFGVSQGCQREVEDESSCHTLFFSYPDKHSSNPSFLFLLFLRLLFIISWLSGEATGSVRLNPPFPPQQYTRPFSLSLCLPCHSLPLAVGRQISN